MAVKLCVYIECLSKSFKLCYMLTLMDITVYYFMYIKKLAQPNGFGKRVSSSQVVFVNVSSRNSTNPLKQSNWRCWKKSFVQRAHDHYRWLSPLPHFARRSVSEQTRFINCTATDSVRAWSAWCTACVLVLTLTAPSFTSYEIKWPAWLLSAPGSGESMCQWPRWPLLSLA